MPRLVIRIAGAQRPCRGGGHARDWLDHDCKRCAAARHRGAQLPPEGKLATIHITYPKIIARVGPCGLWPADVGPSMNRDYFENQPPWNFGCASQRNLAASVDNPADLVQPRGETPAYEPRRDVVVTSYAKGQPTATQYPDEVNLAVGVGR